MSKDKHSILIIDDDPAILRTMSRLFAKAGYSTYTAQTGKEASEKLSTQRFDVALIDIGLGETLGTDLLPQMDKVAPKMLKIVFTGTPMSDGTLDKARREADIFLLKPVEPETLLQILDEKLELKNMGVSR